MLKKRNCFIVLFLLLLGTIVPCWGQYKVREAVAPVAEGDTLPRMQWHTSLFTGVYSGFGPTTSYTGVAPRWEYKVNEKLQLRGGFSVAALQEYGPMAPQETMGRSLAPRRPGTTGLVEVDVAADYKQSDNLWLTAHLFYLGNAGSPLGFAPVGHPQGNLYGGSASLHFRTRNDSKISVYLNIFRDEGGRPYRSPLLYSDLYGYLNDYWY